MLGAELTHCDPRVRAVAMTGYQRLVQLIADRRTHLSRPEALAIASGTVSTMAGAVVLANITQDRATARSILGDAHALIRDRLSRGGRLS